MKKYIPSAIGFLIGLSLIIGGFAANKPSAQNEPPCFEIIKDTTDDRGLISIVITDGIDTFAYDYLKPLELANLKANNFQHTLINTGYVCPDCGEWGCIYEAIDDCVEGGTDQDIENAIQAICKERGITDPKIIDLLRANYYL